LIAVLLAPAVPMLVNISLGTFLELLGLLSRLDRFLFLARVPFFLDEVDATGTAIALHQQAGRIPSEPGILQRNVLERA
jgi:hypothetical protein